MEQTRETPTVNPEIAVYDLGKKTGKREEKPGLLEYGNFGCRMVVILGCPKTKVPRFDGAGHLREHKPDHKCSEEEHWVVATKASEIQFHYDAEFNDEKATPKRITHKQPSLNALLLPPLR